MLLFKVLSTVIFVLGVNAVCGQGNNKYALVIGIDNYLPGKDSAVVEDNDRPRIVNLDGCKNDALSIVSVIESRFGFDAAHVDTLFDNTATRDNILKSIDQLLNKSNRGDVAFIFYAGHGSQVYNSMSKEPDRLDESIVPADTRQKGIEDIRDKELSEKFNDFLDKGVNLTVILDCCHSASMSRGPDPKRGKLRFVVSKDGSEYDAKDPSTPVPPETRKDGSFLMISACQDNEPAEELRDDNTPSQTHGVFTLALLEALDQQSIDASALNLFVSTRAIIKSNGKKQEPVLAGTPQREQQTLFGIGRGTLPNKCLVAISGFSGTKVILQGGFAIGLNKGNELKRSNDKDAIVLKIDSVLGVNKSIASIKEGNITDVKAGELFEVSNWVFGSGPLLKLFVTGYDYPNELVEKLVQINKQLRVSKKINWVNDLEKKDPWSTIYFDSGKCYMKVDTLLKKELKDYSAAAILNLSKKDSSLYFEIPPSRNLASAIEKKLSENKSIHVVQDPTQANYVVYGTIDEHGNPAYGLRRLQVNARDSLESMPVQTKSFPLKDYSKDAINFVSDSLFEYAVKLSKIRGWLTIPGPKADARNAFPYHLEIFDSDSGKVITTGNYKIGENIALHLVANKDYTRYTGRKRFVYIFGIDKSGSMYLFYPAENDGNQTNRFPRIDGGEIVKDFAIIDYTVPEPSGTDNFFLLATDEQIPNYAIIFNQEGVRANIVETPFGRLMSIGNVNTRGLPPPPLPDTWNLYKLSFKCTH